MRSVKLRVHPAAEQELRDALEHSEADFGPLVARRLLQRFARVGDWLMAEPGIGTKAPGDARLVPLGRFPYSLVYRVDADTVTVLALMHQSRLPGYWRRRR